MLYGMSDKIPSSYLFIHNLVWSDTMWSCYYSEELLMCVCVWVDLLMA